MSCFAASEIGEGLDAAAEQDDAWEAANLALMREAHLRATAIPRDLVEASSRANSACETIWRVARPNSDFAMVRAALAEVVESDPAAGGDFGGSAGADAV